jgi:hypothetical protein
MTAEEHKNIKFIKFKARGKYASISAIYISLR